MEFSFVNSDALIKDALHFSTLLKEKESQITDHHLVFSSRLKDNKMRHNPEYLIQHGIVCDVDESLPQSLKIE